jgi:hypothetical protein
MEKKLIFRILILLFLAYIIYDEVLEFNPKLVEKKYIELCREGIVRGTIAGTIASGPVGGITTGVVMGITSPVFMAIHK